MKEHGQAGGEFPTNEKMTSKSFSSLVHKLKKEDSFIKRGSINTSSSSRKINDNSIKDALEMMQIQGSKILSTICNLI